MSRYVIDFSKDAIAVIFNLLSVYVFSLQSITFFFLCTPWTHPRLYQELICLYNKTVAIRLELDTITSLWVLWARMYFHIICVCTEYLQSEIIHLQSVCVVFTWICNSKIEKESAETMEVICCHLVVDSGPINSLVTDCFFMWRAKPTMRL